MLLEELEFSGDLTEENIEELKQVVEDKRNTAKWLTIECFVTNGETIDGVHLIKKVLEPIADEEFEGIKNVLILEESDNDFQRKVKIKLFDNEPILNEIFLN